MELRQIRYFATAAEFKSFTVAAQRLYVTQSTISEQIAVLENELGCTLFERTSRGLKLTEAGHHLLRYGVHILESVQDLYAASAKYQLSNNNHSIRVGVVTSPLVSWIPQLLKQIENAQSPFHMHVEESTTPEIIRNLIERNLDIGIVNIDQSDLNKHSVRWAAGLESAFTVRHLYTEKLVVIVPATHRLANCEFISLSELAWERFVTFPRGFTLRSAMEEACGNAGFSPQVAHEVRRIDVCIGFVQAGLGVSLLPAGAVQSTDSVAVLSLVGSFIPYRVLSMIFRTADGQQEYVLKFTDVVKSLCKIEL